MLIQTVLRNLLLLAGKVDNHVNFSVSICVFCLLTKYFGPLNGFLEMDVILEINNLRRHQLKIITAGN